MVMVRVGPWPWLGVGVTEENTSKFNGREGRKELRKFTYRRIILINKFYNTISFISK